MSVETLVVITAVGMLIGLAKGGFGPVLGALATPVLSLTMPVSKAVAMTLPLLMVGDLFALPLYWRQWDMRQIKLLLPAAVVGVLIGTYLLSALPDSWLRPILGGSTLLLVIYKLAAGRLTARHYTPQDWHGAAAGAASGFGSAVANAGGPPFTAYLMLQNLSPAAFMGTTTLFFITVNAIKFPSFWLSGLMNRLSLPLLLVALPVLLIGTGAGRYFVKRVDPKTFDTWMLGLLVAASVLLFI
jgi:uncharacterized membrane protein YfcA